MSSVQGKSTVDWHIVFTSGHSHLQMHRKISCTSWQYLQSSRISVCFLGQSPPGENLKQIPHLGRGAVGGSRGKLRQSRERGEVLATMANHGLALMNNLKEKETTISTVWAFTSLTRKQKCLQLPTFSIISRKAVRTRHFMPTRLGFPDGF